MENQFDWIKSLEYGAIIWHEFYGKQYFRRFTEKNSLDKNGHFAVVSPDLSRLKVTDESFLSCHGGLHHYDADDFYPTEEAMLTVIASKLQNKLEAIAEEAKTHSDKFKQMLLWLESNPTNTEIAEYITKQRSFKTFTINR